MSTFIELQVAVGFNEELGCFLVEKVFRRSHLVLPKMWSKKFNKRAFLPFILQILINAHLFEQEKLQLSWAKFWLMKSMRWSWSTTSLFLPNWILIKNHSHSYQQSGLEMKPQWNLFEQEKGIKLTQSWMISPSLYLPSWILINNHSHMSTKDYHVVTLYFIINRLVIFCSD